MKKYFLLFFVFCSVQAFAQRNNYSVTIKNFLMEHTLSDFELHLLCDVKFAIKKCHRKSIWYKYGVRDVVWYEFKAKGSNALKDTKIIVSVLPPHISNVNDATFCFHDYQKQDVFSSNGNKMSVLLKYKRIVMLSEVVAENDRTYVFYMDVTYKGEMPKKIIDIWKLVDIQPVFVSD